MFLLDKQQKIESPVTYARPPTHTHSYIAVRMGLQCLYNQKWCKKYTLIPKNGATISKDPQPTDRPTERTNPPFIRWDERNILRYTSMRYETRVLLWLLLVRECIDCFALKRLTVRLRACPSVCRWLSFQSSADNTEIAVNIVANIGNNNISPMLFTHNIYHISQQHTEKNIEKN